MARNLRVVLSILVIYHVHSSTAYDMLGALGRIATNIYQQLHLGPAYNDDTIIQERESNEMSLMQEIKAGRHGHAGKIHIYGRHQPGNRLRGARPLNLIDVRANYD